MKLLLTSNPITAVAAAEWYLPWSRLSMSFRILAMVPKKLQKRSERLHSLSSAIRQRSGGGQSTNTLCLASIKAKLYMSSSIKDNMLIFWRTKRVNFLKSKLRVFSLLWLGGDLAFFDHLPPSVYIFYDIKVYKKSIFLTTYPPPLVNVVCERPLIKRLVRTLKSTESLILHYFLSIIVLGMSFSDLLI
jgi:hypothetical protein